MSFHCFDSQTPLTVRHQHQQHQQHHQQQREIVSYLFVIIINADPYSNRHCFAPNVENNNINVLPCNIIVQKAAKALDMSTEKGRHLLLQLSRVHSPAT